MTDKPIIPTKVIPAAETVPAPVSPPPPPPRPPAPPAVRDPEPEWYRIGPVPSGPPPPVPVDVHVTVTIDPGGSLIPADPEPPGPRWYARIRWGYNAACSVCGFVLCGPWAWVLTSIRDKEALSGAWVAAVIPLIVLGFLDNARQVEARCSHPDLWAPKWRAAIARILLWSAAEATALTLPLASIVYVLTGAQP